MQGVLNRPNKIQIKSNLQYLPSDNSVVVGGLISLGSKTKETEILSKYVKLTGPKEIFNSYIKYSTSSERQIYNSEYLNLPKKRYYHVRNTRKRNTQSKMCYLMANFAKKLSNLVPTLDKVQLVRDITTYMSTNRRKTVFNEKLP